MIVSSSAIRILTSQHLPGNDKASGSSPEAALPHPPLRPDESRPKTSRWSRLAERSGSSPRTGEDTFRGTRKDLQMAGKGVLALLTASVVVALSVAAADGA